MGKTRKRKNSSNGSNKSSSSKGQNKVAKNKCISGETNDLTNGVLSETCNANLSVSDAIHGAHSVLFSDSGMDNSVFVPSERETGNGAEGSILSQVSQPLNSEIMSFLRSMNQAMNNKFSSITTQLETLNKLETKVNGIESELCKLWNVVQENNKIQSEKLNKIAENVSSLEFALAESQSAISKLQQEKSELSETLNYMQAQSMRNNLIFSGINESSSEKPDDTERLLRSFIVENLKIPQDDVKCINLERVHRIGVRQSGNQPHPRPIVAKFSLFKDRESVRKSGWNLNGTNFYVSEQFPKDVADRRRSLMPAFRKARADGKKAWLSYDKLYIDGVPVRPDSSTSNNSSGSRK